ncbi:MAG: hypothetical protein KDA60_16205, partial [Planctomycetales bacterium]|nr:hypothetical protein [Planctomycetales bacterium]
HRLMLRSEATGPSQPVLVLPSPTPRDGPSIIASIIASNIASNIAWATPAVGAHTIDTTQ